MPMQPKIGYENMFMDGGSGGAPPVMQFNYAVKNKAGKRSISEVNSNYHTPISTPPPEMA